MYLEQKKLTLYTIQYIFFFIYFIVIKNKNLCKDDKKYIKTKVCDMQNNSFIIF